MSNSLGNLLVETKDRTKLLVEVNISVAVGSLDAAVVSQLNLLAGLTRLLGYDLLNSATLIVLNSHQSLLISYVVSYCQRQNSLCRRTELAVSCNEVGLASQAQKICLLAYDLRYNNALGSSTVSTLANNQLTLLADNILCTLVITLCLDESLLAVHHTGTGHFTELHYICCFDFHSGKIFLRLKTVKITQQPAQLQLLPRQPLPPRSP